MSRVRCCKCKKNKSRHSFSMSQLRKLRNKRSCKACISKRRQQLHQAPPKQVAPPEVAIDPQQNDDHIAFLQAIDKGTHMQIIRKDAARLEEPGQVSFLEKLHSHCLQKSLFTEIYLNQYSGFKPSLSSFLGEKESDSSCHIYQAGMERVFKRSPEIFVYHNRVIIASNSEDEQRHCYMRIRRIFNVIETNTRLCCAELVYIHGKISSNGIEFYDLQNTIQNRDISFLLSKPEKRHFQANDRYEAKESEKASEQEESLMQLERRQKRMKLGMNALSRQWNDKQDQMKRLQECNVLVKWNSIKAKMMKQNDHILNDDDVHTLKCILTAFPDITWRMERTEGQLMDSVLHIGAYTISIPKSMKNHDFMSKLENVIYYLAQDIESRITRYRCTDEKQGRNETNDCLSQLIHARQRDVVHCKKAMDYAARSFRQCTEQITSMYRAMVDEYDRNAYNLGSVLNLNFLHKRLILIPLREQTFISLVNKNKPRIIDWVSKHQQDPKYEGIKEFGANYLFVRFMNFLITIRAIWWISLLRCLTLPINIHNFNLVKKHITELVAKPNRRFGREVDVIYFFMKMNPILDNRWKFTSNDKRNAELSCLTMKMHIEERQIVKLCNDCFRYVINLFPKYKKSTNAKKMNRQIDIYLSKNVIVR
eukprot:250300_1